MTVRALGLGAQAPHSPGFRVRMLLPRPELARLGVEFTPLTLFTAAEERAFREAGARRKAAIAIRAHRRLATRLRSQREAQDVAWVQRHADMLPSLRLERLARRGRRMVLDVDDAIWLDALPAAGGHPLAVLKGSALKVRRLARMADHVVAGNETLAEWLGRQATAITIVPSLVEHRGVPRREHGEAAEVVLGWIGSATTERNLARIEGALARLAAARPGTAFELRVVGGRAPDVPGMRCIGLPWSEENERETLARMDIGLMPLPDNAWTRGKCAYKALQYMAAGVPVVADDVGMSAAAVGNRAGGYIAGGEDDWVEALAELASDAALRQRLGDEGRRRVAERFSVERWAPVLARVLRGAA